MIKCAFSHLRIEVMNLETATVENKKKNKSNNNNALIHLKPISYLATFINIILTLFKKITFKTPAHTI